MATITATVRENLIGIYTGMFKKTPGADAVSEMVVMWEAGKTQKQIGAELAKKAAFTAEYPQLQLPSEFADEVVAWLAGEATSAGKTWATNWIIGKVNAGVSKSDIIVEAVLALRVATNTTDFGLAKDNLNNKIEVGVYYAVTKDQKADSVTTIDGVTSASSTVTSAKAEVDGTSTVGTTYTLTTGVDTVTGGAGNDTINGNVTTAATLSALDNIDGGGGEDTLSVSDPSNNAFTFPTSATIKNVETINVVHASDAAADDVVVDVSNVTGVKTLSVVNSGTATQATVTTKGNVTSLTVTGFDVDTDTAAAGVAITDSATVDTLTSVTLSGLKDSDAATAQVASVTSSALTSLKLVSTAVGATVTAAAATRALELTLDGVTGGVVTDAEATSVTVKGSGSTSSGVTLTAAKATSVTIDAAARVTLADVNIAAATTLTAKGASAIAVNALTTVTALTAINAAEAAGGLTIGAQIGTGVSFTGGAGADSVIVGATTKAIATAGGNDTVTVAGVAALGTGGSIDAGEGTDTLKFSTYANAVTASGATTFEGTVSGFERLELSGANAVAAAAINLANLDDINYVTLSATNTETTTISGMTSGGTIVFKADQTATKDATVAINNANTGTSDVLNVVLSKATALAAVELIAADVETVAITSTETATTLLGTVTHALELNATAAKSLTITGNAGVTFGTLTGATALTSIDASGVTTGLVSFTTAALTAAATIKGGAGNNTVVATDATKAVTYTGGAKVDTITINNAQANVIDTGAGNDVIVVGSGANKITAGDGDDSITVGASAGLTTINVGAGTDTVVLGAIQTAAGFYTSVTGMAAGDKVNFAAVTTGASVDVTLGAKITLGSAASFANYLDAASAAATGGTNAIIKWFQFNGNTYVAVDNSNTTTFADGVDSVIELVGLVDLSTSTTAADVLTLV